MGFAEEYRKDVDQALTKAGFDVTKLTERQRDLIVQPNEAPENFYCDGEISSSQARVNWITNMRNAGLTPQEVTKAVKYVFG